MSGHIHLTLSQYVKYPRIGYTIYNENIGCAGNICGCAINHNLVVVIGDLFAKLVW